MPQPNRELVLDDQPMGERGLLSIDGSLELVLKNTNSDEEPPFEIVGQSGNHTVVYDLGGGVCGRLHYHEGGISKDYEKHIDLATDGFPVPTVRSTLHSDGELAVFAVDLIDGTNTVCEGTKEERFNDYRQLVEIMMLAKEKQWYPADWGRDGNLLRENQTGRIVVVDVAEWRRIDSYPTGEQAGILAKLDAKIAQYTNSMNNYK